MKHRIIVVGLAVIAIVVGACSGSSDPTATPTATPPTAETPTATAAPTATSAPAPTATPRPRPTSTPTPRPRPTSTPTATPSATPRPTLVPTPTPEPTPEVRVTTDVPYVKPQQSRATLWTLDVYAPLTSGDWPAVVVLPGASDSKETPALQALARDIADRGAVVFLPDFPSGSGARHFRTPNGAGMREMFESAACAIRFARSQAAQYGGGSAGRVVVLGQSGGGYLGLWITLLGDDGDARWDEFAAARGGPPKQEACVAGDGSAVPDAFVGYAGAYIGFEPLRNEDAELSDLVSPATYIGSNTDVVIRWMWGSQDTVIPSFAEARHEEIYQSMLDSGYDITQTTIEAGHFVTPLSHGPMVEMVFETIGLLME